MHPRSGNAPRRTSVYDRLSGQRRHKPDYILVVACALLLVIGLVVVYSISPGLAAQREVSENYYISKQLTAILIGIVGFLITANVPLKKWQAWQNPIIFVAIIATIIALILPVTPEYPAHRWLRFGGLSLQSVELVKIALLIWLAGFLSRQARDKTLDDMRITIKPMLMILGVLGLVVAIFQRDLGSAAVLVGMLVVMAFVAGMPMKRISVGLVLVAITFSILVLPFQYRRERVLTFLNPEQNCQTSGYQSCQALIAVGSGGLFGKGLAYTGQAYGYVPEAANDSIFSIYAEKFGFIGATLLISLFVLFFTRLKNIMERAPDVYSRLIVAGVLAWLSTQAIINIGAMLGLLPLKGITLPFISYGGTSIIFVLAAVGLVFNISRFTTFGINTELDKSTTDQPAGGYSRARYGAYTARRP